MNSTIHNLSIVHTAHTHVETKSTFRMNSNCQYDGKMKTNSLQIPEIYRSISSTYPNQIQFTVFPFEAINCMHYKVYLNEIVVNVVGFFHIQQTPIDTYDFACQLNMQIMFTFVYCNY